MTSQMSPPPPSTVDDTAGQGKVRWRRFGIMMTLSALVAGFLVFLTAQGALAVSFSISGMPFVVTADSLTGTGFEQYATLDNMPAHSPNAGNTGGQMVLIVSVIGDAQLTNLCQSIDLGGEFLKLTAGTGTDKVHATTMVVDSSELSGNADFTSINIGQDASTLDAVPGVHGNLGVFGQQASTVTITNLRQTNYATTAARFTLPNLHMSFSSTGC